MRWLVGKGWHGWALLVALVVAFDVLALRLGGESMTDAARRWFNHGVGRWLIIAVTVFLVLHLTVLPHRYDPLHKAYRWLENRYGPNADYEQPDMGEFPSGLD